MKRLLAIVLACAIVALASAAQADSWPSRPIKLIVPTGPFEEFYASVKGKPPSADDIRYRALRTMIDPQLAMFRMVLLPPKTPAATVAIMRQAFEEMWTDRAFLSDYARVMKAEPVLIPGAQGQMLLAEIGTVPKPIKDFLVDYSTRMTSK
jgi:tripartite-type tricarboxylate transporter receptor subunit TctC